MSGDEWKFAVGTRILRRYTHRPGQRTYTVYEVCEHVYNPAGRPFYRLRGPRGGEVWITRYLVEKRYEVAA